MINEMSLQEQFESMQIAVNQEKAPILSLPVEIFLEIMAYLDEQSQYAISQSCRKLNQILFNQPSIKNALMLSIQLRRAWEAKADPTPIGSLTALHTTTIEHTDQIYDLRSLQASRKLLENVEELVSNYQRNLTKALPDIEALSTEKDSFVPSYALYLCLDILFLVRRFYEEYTRSELTESMQTSFHAILLSAIDKLRSYAYTADERQDLLTKIRRNVHQLITIYAISGNDQIQIQLIQIASRLESLGYSARFEDDSSGSTILHLIARQFAKNSKEYEYEEDAEKQEKACTLMTHLGVLYSKFAKTFPDLKTKKDCQGKTPHEHFFNVAINS